MHKTTMPGMGDPIPTHRRELYFKVIDGHKDLHAITMRLHFLDNHFPPPQLDKALAWLVANNYTGRRFINWFKIEAKKSDLEMHRLLLSVVNNSELGAVVAGKNFKA